KTIDFPPVPSSAACGKRKGATRKTPSYRIASATLGPVRTCLFAFGGAHDIGPFGGVDRGSAARRGAHGGGRAGHPASATGTEESHPAGASADAGLSDRRRRAADSRPPPGSRSL